MLKGYRHFGVEHVGRIIMGAERLQVFLQLQELSLHLHQTFGQILCRHWKKAKNNLTAEYTYMCSSTRTKHSCHKKSLKQEHIKASSLLEQQYVSLFWGSDTARMTKRAQTMKKNNKKTPSRRWKKRKTITKEKNHCPLKSIILMWQNRMWTYDSNIYFSGLFGYRDQSGSTERGKQPFWLGSHSWHIRLLSEYSTQLKWSWLDQREEKNISCLLLSTF